MTIPKVTGAIAVVALGTATFWTDHQDAVMVFAGFVILILGAMFIVSRMDGRIQHFQEQQVKTLRSHIAHFYVVQRRKNRSFERRIIELEEVTRTINSIERNCALGTATHDDFRMKAGALYDNQLSMRDFFHKRLAEIEYKLSLSHDKAITNLTLKGIFKGEP